MITILRYTLWHVWRWESNHGDAVKVVKKIGALPLNQGAKYGSKRNAYAINETLKEFWDQPPETDEAFLRHWYV
ncbi:MAG: hypothetical protein M1499_06275 [Firmicutes bacterium]|nr:hypothetical protein [Bacillota bacterium]